MQLTFKPEKPPLLRDKLRKKHVLCKRMLVWACIH